MGNHLNIGTPLPYHLVDHSRLTIRPPSHSLEIYTQFHDPGRWFHQQRRYGQDINLRPILPGRKFQTQARPTGSHQHGQLRPGHERLPVLPHHSPRRVARWEGECSGFRKRKSDRRLHSSPLELTEVSSWFFAPRDLYPRLRTNPGSYRWSTLFSARCSTPILCWRCGRSRPFPPAAGGEETDPACPWG